MIAVPFIYFTLLSIYLIRKHNGIDLSAFIAMIYAFSAACSILVDAFGIYEMNGVGEKNTISPMATISYCTLLTMSIVPFSRLKSLSLKEVDIQKEWIVDALSWILIITFFTTLYTTFSNLEVVLNSDLKEVRDDVYLDNEDEKLTGIAHLLAFQENLLSQFSPIAILLYFLNIAKGRKSTLFNWMLLLSSLTPVIKAILIAGRTQPIYWFLSFCAIYIICRPMLNQQQRKTALFPFWFFGGLVGLFIAAVTIARFQMAEVVDDSGTFDSLISYSGQSFINFNDFFCNYRIHGIHWDRIFPLTNYFLINPGWNLEDYRDLIWSYSGMNIGVFFTFLGDLMIDLGHMGMWIYIIIFYGVSSYVCQRANHEGEISLSRLLVILILFLIPLQGIFYYSYYKVNVGYFVVGTLIIAWLLSHQIKSKYES